MPERTEYAPGTPSWIDLSTSDLDTAKSFYASVFGWEVDDQPTDQGGTYAMASRNGKAVAGLMPQMPELAEQGAPSAWNTYVTVADADAAVSAAEGAGGTIHSPVMEVMEAGRMAVLGDPTGGVCCVWEPKDHIGAELVNEHGTLTWTDLATTDQGAASAFYSQVFGWDSQEVAGDMGTGTMYMLDGAPIASANDTHGGAPPHWAVYFAVDDCDACLEAVTANGGSLMGPAMDTPPGRMGFAQDPTGAHFNVIQLDPDFDPMAA